MAPRTRRCQGPNCEFGKFYACFFAKCVRFVCFVPTGFFPSPDHTPHHTTPHHTPHSPYGTSALWRFVGFTRSSAQPSQELAFECLKPLFCDARAPQAREGEFLCRSLCALTQNTHSERTNHHRIAPSAVCVFSPPTQPYIHNSHRRAAVSPQIK